MCIGYSYILSRDYGFAPNPFGGFCTLATCKPRIRKNLVVGDYVFGITPRKLGNNLVFAMKVGEKMTYNEYWIDERFQFKKPCLNGSRKTAYGDNIYYLKPDGTWHQSDSHHSNPDGVINFDNLHRDTSVDAVLISYDFFYFGASAIEISTEYKDSLLLTHKSKTILGIGENKISADDCGSIWTWLCNNYSFRIIDFPFLFRQEFKRYDGKS
ncbi:MAG: hypothetical protein M0R38_10615 [Bacteroidia bacterium]|jgi:hypothetical protein|nr:hypothetical protein [Bacteroidia bacterium]